MYANLLDQHGNVTARYALNDAGEAVLVAGSEGHPGWGEINVIAPGPRLVKRHEGQAYLEALPFAYRNPYCHAVFYAEQ